MSRTNDISRDLDNYIALRRTQDPVVPVTQQPKPVAPVEEPVAAVEPEEALPLDEKKGWFGTLMEKVFGPEDDTVDMGDVDEAVVSNVITHDDLQKDMRELAQISLGIIKRLPQRSLEEFKGSDEFGSFKEILRKHSIIK